MAHQKMTRPERCQQTRERNAARKRSNIEKAEKMNAEWRKLSVAHQLAELDKRPGESKKQRKRILKG